MITATITNIVREGNGITVFAQFPEGVRNYSFEPNATNKGIKQRIKQDVDALNDVEDKAIKLKDSLIGEIIE